MEPSITSPSSASSFLCSLEAASLVSEAVVLFSCFEVEEAAGVVVFLFALFTCVLKVDISEVKELFFVVRSVT